MTTDEAIKWAGGTKVKLAERLHMHQSTLSDWGESPPAIRQIQLERLSEGALKADPSCFEPKTAKAA